MNFADLKTAVYESRFPTSELQVPNWLQAAYVDIWNSAPWTFRRVYQATFYTSSDGTSGGAATATPKMPSDFQQVDAVYDQYGAVLKELEPLAFADAYTPVTVGQPNAFTVVNRQVILGPTPGSAFPFLISYRRRISSRTAALAVQGGFMVLDTDLPLWDDHHYLLVLRAKLIGLKDRDDPTAIMLTDEYGGLLSAMQEDYALTLPSGFQQPAWRGA